jgi:UDP-2,4-diacetamido-2,4,6-trideoxy-beta-L-altropyranose hydrolase
MRARPRVLFRVAAGPRIGFGHLMRCRALARALDVPLVVSLRGGALDAAPSRQISGLRLARSIDWKSIDAVVVDDPSAQQASPWLLRARSAGVFTLAVQDLGVSSGPADLTIDGSVTAEPSEQWAACRGPRFMILDPRVLTARAARAGRHSRVEGRRPRVLVALGGGSGVMSAVPALARSLAEACPDMVLEVAAGFSGRARPALTGGRWIDRRGGLLLDLARVDVAVVAGGVTLYEACAVGVPAVAVSIVSAQRHAIEALAARGAVVDAGSVVDAGTAQRVGRSVAALLQSGAARCRLAAAGKRTVDGRGAFRVAAHLRRAMKPR